MVPIGMMDISNSIDHKSILSYRAKPVPLWYYLAMTKEAIHSVMDSPKFMPWTNENWFDDKGILHSRDLFITTIKIKKGNLKAFIDHLHQRSLACEPYSLEFYSPAGMKMTAEVRGLLPSETGTDLFDHIDLLVALTSDQVLTLLPSSDREESFDC